MLLDQGDNGSCCAKPQDSDLIYQETILQSVSRTFALTIPQMPSQLVTVIGNAYLLCRIADTIEDEVSLSAEEKIDFSKAFVAVIQGQLAAEVFANRLFPRLSGAMLDAERDLVNNTDRVIRVTQSFSTQQQAALLRCVETMSKGMSLFQLQKYPNGVDTLTRMNQYCFYVAGVVGIMLTELCAQYSNEIGQQQAALMENSISFGQGLQMTNILKDIWDDYQRGVCWLPQEIFTQYGFSLTDLSPGQYDQAYRQGLRQLIAITHGHLLCALQYTLLIPRRERGIRKFCAWAIGMALLTLDKINENPEYQTGRSVKITRRSVKWVVWLTSLSVSSNTLLRFLFRFVARALPSPVRTDFDPTQITRWQEIDWP